MKVEDLMDHEISEIHKGFDRFDIDKTGTIPTSDIGDCMRWLKLIPSEYQIKELQEAADPEKKGRINFDVFLMCASVLWISDHQRREGNIWSAFLVFDKADKGKLTFDQVRSIFLEIGEEPITEKELKQIFKSFGNKKDNTIDYGYMIRAWQK